MLIPSHYMIKTVNSKKVRYVYN